ncbi:MAG: Panacea domain-containing protein [Gemmatimonadota bacterium]|nr:Panacea domain-containing protein [Gemmatimonadota bacterium]
MSTIEMPQFKERKAAQVAALLIKHNGGQSIDMYKLLKLIYLVDRKALELWGRPVTYDTPKNLLYGPTPSHTYDLIDPPKKKRLSHSNTPNYWSHFFSNSIDHRIRLIKPGPGTGELSPAEVNLIGEIFDKFGHKTFEELTAYFHALPEYNDPGGSSERIEWETLLRVVGWEGEDLTEIKKDLAYKAKFETLIMAR